jgi:hypothetical protein
MGSAKGPGRGYWSWLLALPLAVLLLHLRIELSAGEAAASAEPVRAPPPGASFEGVCDFPGAQRQRLIVTIIDSLRDETALDPAIMPWLAARKQAGLWGHMTPCLSQLSLLCFRTMFEGFEPLLVTGFNNYTGMDVAAPSLIHRLARRGVRVAAVADTAFIRLYESSLFAHAAFEELPPGTKSRDEFGRKKSFEWLADPRIDVLISHVIDTDAVAHRVGVGHREYVAKFRESDDFLRELGARLGPRDSLLVLGDHGHDVHGYHSTGIPSATAYFASGPIFPTGKRLDLDMASAYFLMAGVTCEPLPVAYTGQVPLEVLALSPEYRAAYRRLADDRSPPRPAASGASMVSADLPAVLIVLLLTLFAVRTLFARTDSVERRRTALGTLGLVPGVAVAHAAVLWLALAISAFAFRARSAPPPWVARALGAGASLSLSLGLLSPWVLVTLQNQVNAAWTVGFWSVLVLAILALAWLVRRRLGVSYGVASGLAAWALIFFGLFLGPYYYGSARNLLFGVTWLLLAYALPLAHRRVVRRWLALALVPLVPLHFPLLKEWQPRYAMLEFASELGPLGLAALIAALVATAALLSPERRVWLRGGLAIAGMAGLGQLTDLRGETLLAASLLAVSYLAYGECARAVAADPGAAPRSGWLVPVAQASFAFMLYFVLLGSLRFANVDFKFALSFTPIERGEAAAALTAVPLVSVKYFAPILLLFALGPRLDPRALVLLLSKAAAMGLVLIGMELVGGRGLLLFVQLQAQEIALYALLYMTALAAFASGIGRRGPEPAEMPA